MDCVVSMLCGMCVFCVCGGGAMGVGVYAMWCVLVCICVCTMWYVCDVCICVCYVVCV